VALQKNLIDRIGPFETSFWSLVIVLPFFYVLSIGSLSVEVVVSFSWLVWLGILFSGIFSMGLAHLWWNISVQSLGPTTVSVYSNGIPLVSVLIGWFLLGEYVGLRHVAGGLTLLLGVWLARNDRIRRGQEKLGLPES
jgi:drug/metabolite transporter (DMT)-like permease